MSQTQTDRAEQIRLEKERRATEVLNKLVHGCYGLPEIVADALRHPCPASMAGVRVVVEGMLYDLEVATDWQPEARLPIDELLIEAEKEFLRGKKPYDPQGSHRRRWERMNPGRSYKEYRGRRSALVEALYRELSLRRAKERSLEAVQQ